MINFVIRLGALAGTIGIAAFPQQVSLPGLTPSRAVEQALQNYPSLQISQADIEAAGARIRLARTAYLPRFDALGQVNRATRNNVFGLLLPQSVFPSMSGPAIGSNNFGTVWGSALGALASWEPFDFGERETNLNLAKAGRAQAEAALKLTQFNVAVNAANACVTLIAAQETVRAAQGSVDRAEVVVRSTNALVGAELRPRADASRAQAELAAARTQLIQAQQAVETARATVAQFVGSENPADVVLFAPGLLQLPVDQRVPPLDESASPAAILPTLGRLRNNRVWRPFDQTGQPSTVYRLTATVTPTNGEIRVQFDPK